VGDADPLRQLAHGQTEEHMEAGRDPDEVDSLAAVAFELVGQRRRGPLARC
jgi:hypothetical protein